MNQRGIYQVCTFYDPKDGLLCARACWGRREARGEGLKLSLSLLTCIYIQHIGYYCLIGLKCRFPLPLLIFIYSMIVQLSSSYGSFEQELPDTQITVKAHEPLVYVILFIVKKPVICLIRWSNDRLDINLSEILTFAPPPLSH